MLFFITSFLNVISAFVISTDDMKMVLYDESYDDKNDDMFDIYISEADVIDGSGMSDVLIPTSTYINEDVIEQNTEHDEQDLVGNDENILDNFVANTVQYIIGWISSWF